MHDPFKLLKQRNLDLDQAAFLKNKAFIISPFFPNDLQGLIQDKFFKEAKHAELFVHAYGTQENLLAAPITHTKLMALFASNWVLDYLNKVTDLNLSQIHSARIFSLRANNLDAIDWHTDESDLGNRKLAFSFNLSSGPFLGGELFIRDKKTKEVLQTITPLKGSFHFFLVDAKNQEHKVMPVIEGSSRIAFAGWYK